jgi:hypothetical protein
MGDNKRPPCSAIEDTRRLVQEQQRREQEEREPWEQDRSWREKVPGYALLQARGLPNKLIYRLFQRARAMALWTRTAVIRLPKSKHRVWSEQSLAIEALSCGWDDGAEEWRALRQTRALIEAWWDLHELQPEPLNFVLTLPKAWKYTAKARQEVAERKQSAIDERESKKSDYVIGSFLNELGRPATLPEIAAATGLSSGAVRQQLSRLVRTTEERGWDPGFFRERRGLYTLRVRGSK